MSRSSVVTLNPLELKVATLVGTYRQEVALKRGFQDRSHVPTRDGLRLHIRGAAAELAASRYLLLRWNMTCEGTPDAADLFPNVEVRATPYDDGHLIVYPRDHDDRPYVLVVGKLPELRVAGWLYAREAKQRERRSDGHFWVPQSELRQL